MSNTREIISYVAIIVIGIILAQHMNVVVSGSMEPVFYRGDVVVIEKTDFLGINEIKFPMQNTYKEIPNSSQCLNLLGCDLNRVIRYVHGRELCCEAKAENPYSPSESASRRQVTLKSFP